MPCLLFSFAELIGIVSAPNHLVKDLLGFGDLMMNAENMPCLLFSFVELYGPNSTRFALYSVILRSEIS